MLNAVYKIIAKALARAKVLPNFIEGDQYGCIKGRYVAVATRRVVLRLFSFFSKKILEV